MVISYIGYKSLDTVVDVRENIILNALLKPETTQLDAVVLTDAAVSKNTAPGQRLTTATIEKYSDASLGDALKELAGVYALKTGSGIVKPVVNGLHSSRVPVFANNVRLEDQQWGIEHAPNFDLNSAGKVSVIKGAAALQYSGDAIGGIVLAEGLTVMKDTLFGKTIMSLNSNGRGGSITSALQKGAEKGLTYSANGTIKYMGDREAPDYVLSNTGNREGNFSGNVKYITDKYTLGGSYSFYSAVIGIAAATHIGSVSDLVRAINSGNPNVVRPFTYTVDAPRQEVKHHLAKLNFDMQLSEASSVALQYAFQLNRRQEYDIRRGDDAYKAALDLTLTTHTLQADWIKETGDNTIKAGATGSAQRNEASPETGIRPLIPNYNRYDAGAYGILSHRFSNTLSGEAGLRYDFSHISAEKFYQKSRWDNLGYNGVFDNFITADFGSQWLTNPEFTYHNISASVGIRQKLGQDFELLGNAGLAMRNPNPSELFSDGLHHSNATIELGSLATDTEKAVKLSATLLKNHGSFRLQASPYVNYINDFIFLAPTGVEFTIRGSFPVYRYLQTNALLAGVDLHTDWDITNTFTHSFNLAYIHGTDTESGNPLIDMPPLNMVNTIRYTKKGWKSFFAELRSEAIFTQNRYPDYNFFTDVPQNGELVAVLADVSTPPPGYHLFHFSSGIQFKLGSTQASVNLSVFNIFNISYRDYLNRQRFYLDEAGRNFQLQLKLNY